MRRSCAPAWRRRCEKRPVPREQIDEALSRIVHKVRSLGDREVSARTIGELVMEELRHLDEVAYVRFASVYRQFEDVEAFHEEIQRLRSARSTPRHRRARTSASPAAARTASSCRCCRRSRAAPSANPVAANEVARQRSPTSTAAPCSARSRWPRAASPPPTRIRASAA